LNCTFEFPEGLVENIIQSPGAEPPPRQKGGAQSCISLSELMVIWNDVRVGDGQSMCC